MSARTLITAGLAIVAAACSTNPSGLDLVATTGSGDDDDAGTIAPDSDLDARVDSGADILVTPDSGTDAGTETGANDTIAPLAVANLVATTTGVRSIALTWTAPEDPPGGSAVSYELRYSTANITTDAEFGAATAVTMPSPQTSGSAESFTVNDLDPATTYYFALRARDEASNVSPLSNVVSATTKMRATVLLSEVAMWNSSSDGFDFVELVVTQAGNLKDIEIRQVNSPAILHKFADLEVAVGDRIVVHMTGLPGPANFVQEDAAKSRTISTETAAFASADAWDVYSASADLDSYNDNLITVVDGTTTVDAAAISDRNGNASAASMAAFAAAKTEGAWTFTATPVDNTNDCATEREAVGVSVSPGDVQCGWFATYMESGKSINRIGATDTNTKKDWYIAAQTLGTTNAAIPTPNIFGTPAYQAVAKSTTTVEISFSQEIDDATVAAALFSGSGITISDAVLSGVNRVTVTTSPQNGPHIIGIGSALKTIYGGSVPSTARFCGYEPLGGMLRLSEINPTVPGIKPAGADLIELIVTRAGMVHNFGLVSNPIGEPPANGQLLASTGDLCGALGDIVVVHLDPPDYIDPSNHESLAKNELPVATHPENYDGAWDIRGYGGTNAGLTNTDGVLFLRRYNGSAPGVPLYTPIEAIVYTNANGNVSENPDFIASLQYMQSLGMWLPANCGGAPCTALTTPSAEALAAPLTGIGNSATTNSLRKSGAGDPSSAASWSVGAQSWGLAN